MSMIINEKLAQKVIQPRPSVSHKGTFGRVLLIGGLYPYGGAIIMAALAAVNAGSGLVTVATTQDNIAPLHSHLPEAMAFDLTEGGHLSEQLSAADVILIGPGLGEKQLAQETFDLVLEQVSSQQVLIIDGSALNLLAQKHLGDWPSSRLILTPHQKEWERLSGIPISRQTEEAAQAELARLPQGTLLLAKSHQTKIYSQSGQVGELAVGGPHQATGGMGDTLAGLIAGFVAQFRTVSLFDCTAAATYIHSAIADELAQAAYVVLPTRISYEIPRWMKKISSQD